MTKDIHDTVVQATKDRSSKYVDFLASLDDYMLALKIYYNQEHAGYLAIQPADGIRDKHTAMRQTLDALIAADETIMTAYADLPEGSDA
jgi:hypothetical protein